MTSYFPIFLTFLSVDEILAEEEPATVAETVAETVFGFAATVEATVFAGAGLATVFAAGFEPLPLATVFAGEEAGRAGLFGALGAATVLSLFSIFFSMIITFFINTGFSEKTQFFGKSPFFQRF